MRDCSPSCPCSGQPLSRPRRCPVSGCGHVFTGNGWDGIDAHYRARHEKQTGRSYDDWWSSICEEHCA